MGVGNGDAGALLKPTALFGWLAFGFLALDQASKLFIRSTFAEHQSETIIPRFLDITLTYNRGIAFGMFQGFGILLAPIAVAIAIGAWLYTKRHPHESKWIHVAMGLLCAGAIGNLIDRVFLGKVTDMIAVRFVDFPVFNIADSCITVAGAILVFKWARESKTQTADPETGSSETPPTETQFS